MSQNDEMLAIRMPSQLKQGLDTKHPEVRERNNVIRALIQKYLRGEIKIASYELEITT